MSGLSRLLSIGLAILLVGAPPVRGDVGRNGGIVILPSAIHVSEWGKGFRMTCSFQVGQSLTFQLAGGLEGVVVVTDNGISTPAVGSLSGSVFTLGGGEVEELQSAGVTQFQLRFLDANLRGYLFDIRISPTGQVDVSVS